MDGVTGKTIHKGTHTITVLSEFIINSSKNNNAIAHFEWDKDLNIISYNNLALGMLLLNDRTQPINKVSDLIPPKYLTDLNTHIQELIVSELHISTFSYQIETSNTQINITWLSAIENKKILTICCQLQTNILTEDSISILLKVIPTPALVIGQEGQYIGCNNLMLRLLDVPGINSVEDLLGNTVGTLRENPNLCKYIRSVISLAKPNLIREIQTTFNLNTGNKVYYLFSYSKHNNLTILVGLDITNVKQLERDLLAAEERNVAILKALPDVMKTSSLRRKDNKMDTLINQLTEDPIFTTLPNLEKDNSFHNLSDNNNNSNNTINDISKDKELYSKLIRLEVETREINVRLKQIETLIYLGDTSFINRLKYTEISNETLVQRCDEITNTLDKTDKDMEFIRLSRKLINVTPGGLKVVLSVSLIGLTILIFGISYLVDTVGVKKTIDNIRNPPSFLKP